MITSISSQPLGGSYKEGNFKRNVITTEWIEETKPSTDWFEIGFNWWDTLTAENFENLLTETNENLLIEQQTELVWSEDLIKPSTVWRNA